MLDEIASETVQKDKDGARQEKKEVRRQMK